MDDAQVDRMLMSGVTVFNWTVCRPQADLPVAAAQRGRRRVEPQVAMRQLHGLPARVGGIGRGELQRAFVDVAEHQLRPALGVGLGGQDAARAGRFVANSVLVTLAALENALKIVDKPMADLKIVAKEI